MCKPHYSNLPITPTVTNLIVEMEVAHTLWHNQQLRIFLNNAHLPNLLYVTKNYRTTVRPRNTRPQAARTLQVHVFELGPKIFELNEFI